MIARLLPGRGGQPVGIRIGGFNLLPYRQHLTRGRRRRLIAESAAVVLCGALAALAWTGWDDAFGASGSMRRRAELKALLADFAAPLAEYRQLERAGAGARERKAIGAELAKPRARFLGIAETLSRAPNAGVVLRRLTLTGKGLALDATAVDALAATAWIERLGRAHGVRVAEITHWRSAAGAGSPSAVDIAARLQWEGEGPADAPSSNRDSIRGRR
ncbi:PilN domain-containing protein [Trinickia sp. EG282A]|uniref:PilN domain-containing protein n=1 Tax=Trinickia sp. EG282A TaxID=3237013 RepID=UPI0034D2EC64